MRLQNLLEASYQPSDIPEFFYVAIHYLNNYSGGQQNYINQFAQGRFKGISGITDKMHIAEGFIYSSPILFKMDGTETAYSNNLSMVNYHNLDYLVSNNLSAFKRVTDASADALFASILYAFDLPAHIASKQLAQKFKTAKVNSLNQFVFFLLTHLKDELKSRTSQEVKTKVSEVISLRVANLAQENEWVVKDKLLVIPRHSEATVYRNYLGSHYTDEFAAMIKQHNLEEMYFFKYIEKEI